MEAKYPKIVKKFEKMFNILVLILLLLIGILTSIIATAWVVGGEDILSLFTVFMGLFLIFTSLRGIIVNTKQLLSKHSDKYIPLINAISISFLFLGVALTLLGIYLFYEELLSKQWKSITAIVEESELKIEKTSWTPVINYSYVYDGKRYFGILHPSGGTNDIVAAQKFVARHPAGSSIPIKINVKNPYESKLDEGIMDYMQGLSGIAGGLIFFFVGIWIDRRLWKEGNM